MRQRTVFASALLHEPQVLIVDEPTVGLDPRSVRLLKDLLRAEAGRGVTIFLSTHSLDIAEELAHRIGVVGNGKLIGCGSLDALRTQAALDGSLEEVFLKLTEEKVEDSILGNGKAASRNQDAAIKEQAGTTGQETGIREPEAKA
jgi:ABC-2 type transport system ATP-binding protein